MRRSKIGRDVGWSLRSRPQTFEEPELRKSNLTCQIGHLGRLLQGGSLPSFGTLLGEPVAKMNGVRKCLAHYRPLSLTVEGVCCRMQGFASDLSSMPNSPWGEFEWAPARR